MLVFKTQMQLVDASASISRAYLRAASDTLAASAGRSWSLWIEMLAASARHAATAATDARAPSSPPSLDTWLVPAHWPWLACGGAGVGWPRVAPMWWVGPGWMLWRACTNVAAHCSSPTPLPPAAADGRSAPDATFARYRSAGGHAAAQVIVPTIALADVTAKATLSPVQTMLGVWRAALGASS
jgi:hypothetical protein